MENNTNVADVPTENTVSAPAKTILVGTPTIDGKLDAWYVNSLVDTVRICAANNIFLKPIFLAYESILPQARNEVFKLAFDNKFDHMVFIDSDVGWDPVAFMDTVLAPEPVVALPYPLKSNDSGNYNINLNPSFLTPNEKGFVKVISAGTGFFKIDRAVVEALWNSNVSLFFRDKELKNICEYTAAYTSFVGEDVTLCNKIRELGFDIWVNTNSTCIHIGNRVHTGDFKAYVASTLAQQQKQAEEKPSAAKEEAPSLFDT